MLHGANRVHGLLPNSQITLLAVKYFLKSLHVTCHVWDIWACVRHFSLINMSLVWQPTAQTWLRLRHTSAQFVRHNYLTGDVLIKRQESFDNWYLKLFNSCILTALPIPVTAFVSAQPNLHELPLHRLVIIHPYLLFLCHQVPSPPHICCCVVTVQWELDKSL